MGGRVRGRLRAALPVLVVVAVVLGANAPSLLGLVVADPLAAFGAVNVAAEPGLLPGLPTIDPNGGRTSQAFGTLAAQEWLAGRVPWWNPYVGLGAPLAGNMQSAAFFPPTLLMLLPDGFLLFTVVLQLVGALATHALARRLGARPWIAAVAGSAFGLNGTAAWFEHAAAYPVPFLPLLLLGVEQASAAAARAGSDARRWRAVGGVATTAVALALSLYAGFPETAYLDGLLAVVWTLVRAGGRPWRQAVGFLVRVAAGVVGGLLLAAPVLLAFLHYLTEAYLGGHTGPGFAPLHLEPATAPQLLLPYAFGPIFGFAGDDQLFTRLWRDTGGYVTAAFVPAAVVGLLGRRGRALRLALLAWVVLALGRVYGVPVLAGVVNALPEVGRVAAYRYLQPSVALAVVLLAALGVEDVARRSVRLRSVAPAVLGGLGVVALAATGAVLLAAEQDRRTALAPWTSAAVGWGALSALLVGVALLALLRWRGAAVVLALVLVVDVVAAFVVPQLSAPRSAERDDAAIAFLQERTDTERIFTFGPLAPNYGSQFRVPTINVLEALTPLRFARHLRAELDPDARPILFLGTRSATTSPDPVVELLQHVTGYRAAAVELVVTEPGRPVPPGSSDVLREVFRSPTMTVYRLRGALPYLSTSGGGCALVVVDREEVETTCDRPGRLLRRELSFPGWSATVDGRPVPVERVSAYQAVDLPLGTSRVVFSYAPPGATAAWAGLALGALLVLVLAVPLPRRRRRAAPARDAAATGDQPPATTSSAVPRHGGRHAGRSAAVVSADAGLGTLDR